jgi:hypothetical protein
VAELAELAFERGNAGQVGHGRAQTAEVHFGSRFWNHGSSVATGLHPGKELVVYEVC